jgi:predicted nucleic acid-binding protein
MYLLDTNVISEVRKAGAGKADANVLMWIALMPEEALFISAITMFELELGVLQMERRDPMQGAALRRWIEEGVKDAFSGRVLAADAAVAIRSAVLSVSDPRPFRDTFIGATAKERGFILVTRNVRDFQGMSVDIIDPWDAAT